MAKNITLVINFGRNMEGILSDVRPFLEGKGLEVARIIVVRLERDEAPTNPTWRDEEGVDWEVVTTSQTKGVALGDTTVFTVNGGTTRQQWAQTEMVLKIESYYAGGYGVPHGWASIDAQRDGCVVLGSARVAELPA